MSINYSKYKQDLQADNHNNFDHVNSYSSRKPQVINVENWEYFLSYYRYHIDEFAINILKAKLYPFQRLMLRAMAHHKYSMLICSRGLGKSYLTGLFFVCAGILYPGIKMGIASGVGNQARMVIVQKIDGELYKTNENIRREIKNIKTGKDDCVVEFFNGSEIRAITLGNSGGDSARGWRFNYLLVDEARLVSDDVIETILIPMTKTSTRQNAQQHEVLEEGKVIYISSAYLKTSALYKRFMHHYKEMMAGNPDYYVCTLPYQVGVGKLYSEKSIVSELDKPQMTQEKFDYE